MNLALIFAGGYGQRMNTRSIPKQFLSVDGKPIIIHTLEVFESSAEIDAIIISCVAEYIEYLESQLARFHIRKVKAIVAGGSTGQESICNGLVKASEIFPSKSIVLIHDGVRPFIDGETIRRNVESVKKYGSAITTSPVTETVGIVENGEISQIVKRQNAVICRAPQSFYLEDVLNLHRQALQDGLSNATDTASLMKAYGKKLKLIEGPVDNIKITTQLDFFTLKSFFDKREFQQFVSEGRDF